MRKLLIFILSLIIIVLSFATTIKGKVIKITDGDTITILEENGDKTRVRFYGIDAPEKKQDYGIKSLNVLKKLIDKKEIEIEIKNKDQYGRIVGVVYYDKININLYMLETGNAWWYKQYSKHNIEFKIAEEKAKSEKIGLWKEKNPTPPWIYRKEKKH